MMYLELFWNFFQIGLFSFGGGYAALPLIQSRIVEMEGWLSLTEFADLIAISQMTPGPIAITAATFVGTRVGGITGALVATFGNVLPAAIIISILAYLYAKYSELSFVKGVLQTLRPIVVALITSAGLSILLLTLQTDTGGFDWISLILTIIIAFGVFLVQRFKWSSLPVMLTTGALAGVLYLLGVRF